MESTFWSIHSHSRESASDALPSVARMVSRAAELGYPAFGLTDHGSISGAVEFYLECKKAGIKPLIGVEAYIALDRLHGRFPYTMHSCIIALTEQGYRNLCWLVTLSNQNFRTKPILDFSDLAMAYETGRLEGLMMTSGCWFGLVPKLMREGDYASVPNVTSTLAQWFGDKFFIEIQNHQIEDDDHDDEAQSWLLHNYAVEHDLPTIIAQDSHYIYAEDQKVHDAFKTLSSWSKDPEDATFPGDGYHMVDTEWMADHHHPEIYARAMESLDWIAEVADVQIPELDSFELRVPDTTSSGDADTELMEAVDAALTAFIADKRIPASKAGLYRMRAEEELEVITTSEFSGYIMLVKSVCDFIRDAKIVYRVRGSATGSLVCWVLGITGYDPLKWKLSFDRFLSRDRAKPPDVDIDVEHERRHEVLDWLKDRFYVCHISTSMKYGLKSDEEGEKGTLIGAFRSMQDKTGADKTVPIPKYWMSLLERIAYYNGQMPDGTEIDPPLKSVGQHPAGVLVAPSVRELDEVPKRWIVSSSNMVSAYDQGDVERLGMVKLDILGLRTLTALRFAEEFTGVSADDLPLTDKATYARIGAGKTDGMFQLEGWTARKGVRRMKPTKIADIIAAMALFRPAAMKSGATDSFLMRRAFLEEIPERHKLIAKHTGDTYGVLVYQEQALEILKDLGLSVEDIEKARKAIKASNANVGNAAQALADLMEHIGELAREKGMSESDIEWLAGVLNAYAGYSFNRAHATAYGIFAYQTAYFATHHKVAFWTGSLISAVGAQKKYGVKPEDLYTKAAKADGVKIRPPHVNESDITYSTDGNYIYRGLLSIKDVGIAAAEELVEHAPYESLDDLARRVAPGRVTGSRDLGKGHSPAACSGNIKHLHEAGALDGLKWEISTGPMDKAARNNIISVANKAILDVTGARISRKTLGVITDALDVDETFWALPRPDRAQLVADTYLTNKELYE